jgi:flavin-dependent dehydrogenase
MPRTTFERTQRMETGSTVVVREDGVRRELHARFVVGADGARSRVARDFGLDVNDRFLVGVEDVLEARNSRAIDTLHCFLDGELAPGYIAWVAGDAQETHVGVAGELGGFDPNVALEKFRERVAQRFELGGSTRNERRGGLIPVNGILKRISCDRGLLIGDAAGAVSPLTAGGLDACIRLSGAAARVLAEAVRRNDGGLLAEFDGARFRARFVSRLWMRRLISSVSSAVALDAAVCLAALPPFRPIARHVFFGRGSFPDVQFAFERANRVVEA